MQFCQASSQRFWVQENIQTCRLIRTQSVHSMPEEEDSQCQSTFGLLARHFGHRDTSYQNGRWTSQPNPRSHHPEAAGSSLICLLYSRPLANLLTMPTVVNKTHRAHGCYGVFHHHAWGVPPSRFGVELGSNRCN